MRTVRAARRFDACDILLIQTHDETSGAAGSKKVLSDVPNALQRMSVGARNVLVMRGPGTCAAARNGRSGGGSDTWCGKWRELVERRLVSSVGCGGARSGDGWCVGRVATSSACSTRLPLLPSLPVRPWLDTAQLPARIIGRSLRARPRKPPPQLPAGQPPPAEGESLSLIHI